MRGCLKTVFKAVFLFSSPFVSLRATHFLDTIDFVRRQILFLIPLLLVLTGCDVNAVSDPISTATPEFVTATLPPTAIPQPTSTPAPPSPAPTVPPIEGTTTTQVNVREETSTTSENLGVIPQFTAVQVSGQDATGTWYRIVYSESPSGSGWVRAEYVQVNAPAEIPVILPSTGSGSGVSGLVIQRINIRSGAGANFESLGFLEQNDVVLVTGRDASGLWLQIEFSDSPDGIGWASAEFLQVEDIESLPVIGDTVETGNTEIETPQSVNIPAAADGDSKQEPLAKVVFVPGGIRTLQLESDLSAPEGDFEDWIEFSSSGMGVVIQLSCSSGVLQVELQETGSVLETFNLSCGSSQFLSTISDKSYLLRLTLPPADGFQVLHYRLKIKANQ